MQESHKALANLQIVAQRNVISVLVLALVSTHATALSIGNVRGAVVLGRLLDVAFPVTSDGKSIEEVCVRATVSGSDGALPGNQVQVSLISGSGGAAGSVRVQTSQVVSDPVLTVRIAAGCSGTVVRNFTLLAYPAEVVAAQAIVVPPALDRSVSLGASSRDLNAPAATSSVERTSPPRAAHSTGPKVPAPKRLAAPPTRRAPQAAAPTITREIATEKSRLVMEPLTDWLDAPATLRASPEIGVLPGLQIPTERAAAAALWRTLNLSADEIAQEQLRSLAQSRHLAEVERDKQAAIDAQARLQAQVSQGFSARWVYGLGMLLLLLSGALVWMWSRARREIRSEQADWTQSPAKASEPVAEFEDPGKPAGSFASVAKVPEDFSARLQPTEPELLPSGMIPLEFHTEAHEATPHPVPSKTGPKKAAPAHAVVNSEELFDLQQQAEFFVSVGEHGQAIQVLKQHIEANQATSPLAYLELLGLYRSLSRFEDYNNLRTQLHVYFNAQVPEFAAFARQGQNMFGYPEQLARIEALWADASVVPLLQEMLFRDSTQESQRFELAAYDDLLLLHAIASTTSASARGSHIGRARTTPIQPALPDEPSYIADANALPGLETMLEFEQDWDFQAPPVGQVSSHDSQSFIELDLDLSALGRLDDRPQQGVGTDPLPFLTDATVPPVPPSEHSEGDPPIGFGANSDRFEARMDPEVRKPK